MAMFKDGWFVSPLPEGLSNMSDEERNEKFDKLLNEVFAPFETIIDGETAKVSMNNLPFIKYTFIRADGKWKLDGYEMMRQVWRKGIMKWIQQVWRNS